MTQIIEGFGAVETDETEKLRHQVDTLTAQLAAAREGLKAYRSSIKALSATMPGTKVTYFEGPLRDMDAIERWQDLDAAGKLAASILSDIGAG